MFSDPVFSILAAARKLKNKQQYFEVLAELRHFDDPAVDRIAKTRITDRSFREYELPQEMINPLFRSQR